MRRRGIAGRPGAVTMGGQSSGAGAGLSTGTAQRGVSKPSPCITLCVTHPIFFLTIIDVTSIIRA